MDISSSPNQRWLAKEFASSLDQNHRSTRHDVYGYVEFANHLGETEGPDPDPDFCAALRHRLLHELIEDELLPQDELAIRREQRAPRRKGGSHCFERAPREPWIAAASTVLVVCGGAIGLGQESSQALPTDTLYPVKRFFESSEMAIAGSSGDQARELMEQAAERLDEARQLVAMDEVHAQEALPATISDFSEATADAGSLVLEEGQSAGSDPEAATLVSEFRSFSSAAHSVLGEIAADADAPTAALIADAQTMLDGIDQQLPLLDGVLSASEDLPVASDALTMLDLGGGQNDGTGVIQTPLDEASTASVPVVGDRDPSGTGGSVAETVEDLTGPLDQVTEPLDDATSALESSVSVVEIAASDTVSMAVATVNTTVNSVDRTVRQTVDTAKQTLDRTVQAVDQTVRQTVDTAKQTLDQTVRTVDQTVQQAAGSLQQTTDALQSALGSAPEAPAQSEAPSLPEPDDAAPALGDLVEDPVGGLQSTTDDVLSVQLTP